MGSGERGGKGIKHEAMGPRCAPRASTQAHNTLHSSVQDPRDKRAGEAPRRRLEENFNGDFGASFVREFAQR